MQIVKELSDISSVISNNDPTGMNSSQYLQLRTNVKLFYAMINTMMITCLALPSSLSTCSFQLLF